MIDLHEEDSNVTYEHWFDDTKGAMKKTKSSPKICQSLESASRNVSNYQPGENMFIPYLEDSKVLGKKIGAS